MDKKIIKLVTLYFLLISVESNAQQLKNSEFVSMFNFKDSIFINLLDTLEFYSSTHPLLKNDTIQRPTLYFDSKTNQARLNYKTTPWCDTVEVYNESNPGKLQLYVSKGKFKQIDYTYYIEDNVIKLNYSKYPNFQLPLEFYFKEIDNKLFLFRKNSPNKVLKQGIYYFINCTKNEIPINTKDTIDLYKVGVEPPPCNNYKRASLNVNLLFKSISLEYGINAKSDTSTVYDLEANPIGNQIKVRNTEMIMYDATYSNNIITFKGGYNEENTINTFEVFELVDKIRLLRIKNK